MLFVDIACAMAGLTGRSSLVYISGTTPDSKVHGANMGPIWGRQDQGGPHVGPMNFAIWDWHSFVEGVITLYQYPINAIPNMCHNVGQAIRLWILPCPHDNLSPI